MTPELHRPIDAELVPQTGLDVVVEASARECQDLTTRMGIPAVRSLTCAFRLTPDGDHAVRAKGHLRATVIRTCVVSLEDFEMQIQERFTVRFVPAGTETEDDDPDTPDEIPFLGQIIDLGEATAEQLGLALDPYPRKPGAVLSDVAGESGSTNPFAALAALRRKD